MPSNPEDHQGTVIEDIERPVAEPVQPKPGEVAKPAGDDDDLEQHAVEAGGRKLIPLEEAAKLRQSRRDLKGQVETLTHQVEQLKPWVTFGQQAKPIIDALQKNPTVWQAIQRGEVPAATVTPKDEASEELALFAKSLDLYDANGQPDIGRAKTIQAVITKTAKTLVDQEIKPIATTTARDRSHVNLQRMAGYKGPSGKTVDPKVLQAVWQLVPAELSAHDDVAQVLTLAAAGYQSLFNKDQPTVEPEVSEPLIIEAAGGRGGPIRLTQVQSRAAKDIGLSDAEFAKNVKTVIDSGGVLE